ncbi:unnamed protein product [Rhodiola kirilowii]
MRFLKGIRFILWSKSSRRKTEHKPQSLRMEIEEEKRSESSVVKELSWEEVERLTGHLSKVIGYGGFSTVYLGTSPISSATPAAFKMQISSERLDQIFKEELNINLRIQHDNIVKLHGYCDCQERKVLVLEYIANGTLQEKLHGNGRESGPVLPWKTRMMIAFQLAQTIEYLHDKCGLGLVHHDLKSSNILLDENFNCKLCDFGSAKQGISSLFPSRKQVMLGSPGYIDPNYLITGVASKKNDIYSFGVLLLELVTGIEAFELEGTLMGTSLKDEAIFIAESVDPVLRGNFSLDEAKLMVSISQHCRHLVPDMRPSAAEIIQTMKQRVPAISFFCN